MTLYKPTSWVKDKKLLNDMSYWSTFHIYIIDFILLIAVFRGGRGVMGAQPPGSMKSMVSIWILGPNKCWKINPPPSWTNSGLRPWYFMFSWPHCTLYTVHCTLYTVHCTLYTVHCTLFNLHLHGALIIVHSMYNVHTTLFMVQCTHYILRCIHVIYKM